MLWFLLGCEDNCVCPTPPREEPEPVPDYDLLFSYKSYDLDNYVMVYSTKSGETTDSLHYAGDPFNNMIFSHDGRYACYTSSYNLRIGNSETLVTTWPGQDTVAHLLGTGALGAYLTPDDRYLLLTAGNIVAILTFPDLGIVFHDSLTSWAGALHPSERLAYVTIEPYWDSIFVFDYGVSPVEIKSYQLSDRAGEVRSTRGPLLCTDEYLVFATARRTQPSYLGVFDAKSLEVVVDRQFLPNFRVFSGPLHPDRQRVFLAYNGGMERPHIGGIDVYDVETDVLRPFLAQGEIDMTPEPFVPSDIQFTPDGETMYVMNRADGLWLGPILEIDINSKEVKRRWDFINGFSRLIRLNPRDMSDQRGGMK